jgi:putative transposase
MRTTSHAKSELSYHIIFCTKYRKSVLTGDLAIATTKEIQFVCARYGWLLETIAVMPDHIHMLIQAPPTVTPVRITATIKSIVTVVIFRRFGLLKQRHFRNSGLFSRGCYYGAVGNAGKQVIADYIARQGEPK